MSGNSKNVSDLSCKLNFQITIFSFSVSILTSVGRSPAVRCHSDSPWRAPRGSPVDLYQRPPAGVALLRAGGAPSYCRAAAPLAARERARARPRRQRASTGTGEQGPAAPVPSSAFSQSSLPEFELGVRRPQHPKLLRLFLVDHAAGAPKLPLDILLRLLQEEGE
jgi:hypothetical protein